MAGIIIQHNISLEEFFNDYNKEEERADLLRTSYDKLGRPKSYKKTLWSVWALENLKHSGPLLNVISMLDPDEILEDIFNKPDDASLLEGYPQTSSEF